MRYPGEIDQAVAQWLEGQGAGMRSATQAMSKRYKSGGATARADLAAYVAARLPATFATNKRVLGEVAAIARNFAPKTLLDVGAGPGTATWAALQQWSTVAHITQIESNPAFRDLALHFNMTGGVAALLGATMVMQTMQSATLPYSDVVLASYVLAELPEPQSVEVAAKLWQATTQVLVIIEPGTPQGFSRVKAARQMLLKRGAHVVGPCTHAHDCPMTGRNWCHFKTRVQRSRAHMHAKSATVPFEDEPYSWLAVSREQQDLPQGRVVSPVIHSKHNMSFELCDADGLNTRTIATRERALYKQLKGLAWGQAFNP